MPPVSDGRGAPGQVRGREQWSTLHGKQRALWLSKNRFDVWLGSAQRRRQSADQLSREPVLRLGRIAGKAGCLVSCRSSRRPLADMDRRPRIVHESLRERNQPHLIAQPVYGGR